MSKHEKCENKVSFFFFSSGATNFSYDNRQ